MEQYQSTLDASDTFGTVSHDTGTGSLSATLTIFHQTLR
jgi:hypothetical protein